MNFDKENALILFRYSYAPNVKIPSVLFIGYCNKSAIFKLRVILTDYDRSISDR